MVKEQFCESDRKLTYERDRSRTVDWRMPVSAAQADRRSSCVCGCKGIGLAERSAAVMNEIAVVNQYFN